MPTPKIPAITRQERREAALKAIDKAIEAKGSLLALAEHFGIYPSSINHWQRLGLIPPARVKEVARLTGIPPEKIDPYIFGG